ncbi:YheC/YheD family protein [Effusibacillus dendaii]|uniref:ATP-grasp domain-containing protein n=1 Tax=Effusibacillus dendaii TaxID=2743772 RepID=A0A7I8DG82_9BACL|nr:YheC/YheD family protein [Effusibacillus dendaii]BCJ87979.1 hypothetical protein skT53_29640 [Effusibacillus dendaii]
MRKSARRNKWLKYKFMRSFEELAPYLPETELMTKSSFWHFMDKYGRAVVKPTRGRRGRNVILVSDPGNGKYKLHVEKRKIKLRGKRRTYRYLRKRMGIRSYIVQRWISRAKVGRRPFDMRVIVQRKRNSNLWKVTAKVAKVAGKGYIVSNIGRSKGTLLRVKTALKRSSLKDFSKRTLQSNVNKVAILSAEILSKLFPRHRIYGLDMALDRKGRVWIIEANLYPSMSHFLKLKSKKMYRRILAYKRSR